LNIFIAGSGLIGRALHKNLINSENKNVYLLSIRDLPFEKINNIITNITHDDVFVDSMDPNNINKGTQKDHLKKIEIIRSKVLNCSSDFHYIFLSTASIYEHNLELIDEKMILQKNTKSEYLKMKLQNEIFIKSLCKTPFTIARLASIWSDEHQDSFFGDLIKASKEGLYIKPRIGDNEVISYINLNDACNLLNYIIMNRIIGTLNICTDQYNSRSNLKAIVNNNKTEPISKLSGLRIHTSRLNWKKIIGKSEELF
tara:strand:- start:1634 stop:2401 length:768 start_codon:yes stop_codon:yes gene_type:complete